jgi:hypothetical protein
MFQTYKKLLRYTNIGTDDQLKRIKMLNASSRLLKTKNKQSMQLEVLVMAALLEIRACRTSRHAGLGIVSRLAPSAEPGTCGQFGAERPAEAPRRKRHIGSFGACLLASRALFASGASAGSVSAQWLNGPPQRTGFFPINAWWRNQAATGRSGSYSTIGAAATALTRVLAGGFVAEAACHPGFGRNTGDLRVS